MRLSIMAMLGAALIASASAEPMGTSGMGTFGLQQTDPALHGGNPLNRTWSRYSPAARKLSALRDEGLKMQNADGGKLSEEHRAYLQAKLDAILAEARQKL